MDLIREKVRQAVQLLEEMNMDVWLTFVRETSGMRDPVMDFIFGPGDLTWESALLLARSGETKAVVGRYEADAVERLGVYSRVIGYDESIRPHLISALDHCQPRTIAINTSRNNVHADGLTHGMYELLRDHLAETKYLPCLQSSEIIINALRGRKTPLEVERVRCAVATTATIYRNTFNSLRMGQTEAEIASFMHDQVKQLGLDTAWNYAACPIINAGPQSPIGHGIPGEYRLEPGQIIHFDFGIRQEGYCSDIQRIIYVLRPEEQQPPHEVQKAFAVIRQAIETARLALKPNVVGRDVDSVARAVVTAAGYTEYKYATGHQVGRLAHDGGALLGPPWERYKDSPDQKVEAGFIFTLEPGVVVPGYGYLGLEEDVLVTENGAEYLGEPQTEILTMQP